MIKDRLGRKDAIDFYRKEIQILEKQQDRLFSKVCKLLGIHPQGKPKSDILFDHLFNRPSQTTLQLMEELWPAQDVAKSSATKLRTIQSPDK